MDAQKILQELRDPANWDLEPGPRFQLEVAPPRRRIIATVATIAIAAVFTIALFAAVGIGIRGIHHPSPAVSQTIATATPSPTASAETVVPIPDGVIARGTFAHGKVAVVKAGDNLTLNFTGPVVPTTGHPFIAIADSVVTARCAENNVYQLAWDDIPSPKITDYDTADPSFWKTVLIVQYPTNLAAACSQPILDRAVLHWSVPNTHPELAVKDVGRALGATGLTTVKNGIPSTYLTASGDTWGGIAARFEISKADLAWLNPIRHPGTAEGVAAEAYAGQTLNLDPDNRGNSESRRAYPSR